MTWDKIKDFAKLCWLLATVFWLELRAGVTGIGRPARRPSRGEVVRKGQAAQKRQ